VLPQGLVRDHTGVVAEAPACVVKVAVEAQ